MIRPPSDIDLFVVLDADKHANEFFYASDGPERVLVRFHSVLKAAYPFTPVRKDHPAVHLDFSTYGFDVVPAFPRNGGGFLILTRTAQGWISTDPTKHADRTTTLNSLTGNYFVPCVKMIKSWNRSKNFGRLSGFHLETECGFAWPRVQQGADQVLTTPSGFASAIAALLSTLSSSLASRTPDPAGLGTAIDDYLTADARRWTRGALSCAAESAHYALTHERNGHTAWAIGRWRDALGDDFPAYG